jgi:toxin YhaV
MTVYNGWPLYAFELFGHQFSTLKEEVKRLRAKDPEGYKSHPTTILLASVYWAITVTVPENPDHLDFRLEHTLGKTYAHWRRVKKGLPARYRLFFRFGSQPIRIIVYAWLNDESTLRKTGAKTDVYATFRRMLSRGEVPTSLEELNTTALTSSDSAPPR